MRDDYKLEGPVVRLDVEVEKPVSDQLKAMCQHTQLTLSEITNTALRRFISTHQDFLPKNYRPNE